MSGSDVIPWKRPGFGKSGRATKVLANYFEIKKSPKEPTWLKYAVEIKRPYPETGTEKTEKTDTPRREPKPVSIEMKRRIFRELEKKKGDEWFAGVNYIFDGEKTLYTTSPIKMKTNVVVTSVLLQDDQDLTGKANEYKIQVVKLDEPLSLSELDTYIEAKNFRWDFFNMESLKALNDLVHSSPSYKYFQFRDSILDPNTRKPLGGGMELWAGFFESVRPGETTYFANVNRTHTVFYEKLPLDVFLCQFLSCRELPATFDEQTRKRVNKVLSNMKVRPLHRPNIKTRQPIRRLSPRLAKEHEFTLKDSKEKTNVCEYFKKVYDLTLKYQHVVEIASRKDEVWPLECCEIIEGQRVPLTQLNGDQLAKMIQFTALLPRINKDTIINEGVYKVLDFGGDPKLKQFGMVLDEKMAEVPARILRAPTISYHQQSKDGAKLTPKFGSWNLKGRKFVRSGNSLNYWFVISCISERLLPRREAEEFVTTLVKTCKGQGIDVVMDKPRIQYPNFPINGNFKQIIEQEYNNSRKYLANRPQLILFLLPPEGEGRRKKKRFPKNVYDRRLNQRFYADIKCVSSTTLGVPSQCVMADNLFEGPSYCANVALKINLKLGGVNSTLEISEIPELTKEPVLLLGADVTHPTQLDASGEDFPSICSVVGSIDQHGSRFIDRHREQKKVKGEEDKKSVSVEKILEMRAMVFEILTEYKQRNKFLPKRIIMYRDGVSESQYRMVLEHELKAIKDACGDMKQPGYKPPVTFIVVGKRHHTRFYPIDSRDGDRNENCLPGLVVDRKIIHPYLFDFFIQSHASLQGTSRPAHYIVLHDENNFNVDKLQEFTYKLCYNYQRATRSVSIPPPVYYAHLSAKHARSHVVPNEQGVTALRPVVPNLAQSNPMYFV